MADPDLEGYSDQQVPVLEQMLRDIDSKVAALKAQVVDQEEQRRTIDEGLKRAEVEYKRVSRALESVRGLKGR